MEAYRNTMKEAERLFKKGEYSDAESAYVRAFNELPRDLPKEERGRLEMIARVKSRKCEEKIQEGNPVLRGIPQ